MMEPQYFDEPTMINAGGIMFGPYGPGRCESVHPGSGLQCFHHNQHCGTHAAITIDTKAGEVKFRW